MKKCDNCKHLIPPGEWSHIEDENSTLFIGDKRLKILCEKCYRAYSSQHFNFNGHLNGCECHECIMLKRKEDDGYQDSQTDRH